MLYVLTGVRGAGKTTLIEKLKHSPLGIVLQPSTTRPPRYDGESEYDFVDIWCEESYAWTIKLGTKFYGMRKSEILKSQASNAFTVFEPISINVFREFCAHSGTQGFVIGLDTVRNLEEQHRRVAMAPSRVMSEIDFDFAKKRVAESDYIIEGNETDLLIKIGKIVNPVGTL